MNEAKIVLSGEDQLGPPTESAKRKLSSLAQHSEMSAKQMANNLRMVPAQMTDIVTSLASGQKPFTVMIQQGGQLKDVFGGVAPAAKALGGYLLGLINPTTLLVGAAGALIVAYHQGAKESEELNKVLIMTGNYAGKTAGELNEMAKSIAGSAKSTRGAAADALIEVVGTGKIATDQMEEVSAAALAMSSATGRSVKEIVGEFAKLGDEPAKAAAKLNEQYHFLTEAVYEQIKALEEQGDKEQAVSVAQAALAEAQTSRAKKVQENLGFLETAWNGVAKAAKWAWDQMLNLGRDQTGAEQLESLRKQLDERLQRGPLNPQMVSAWEKGNAALKSQIELLERLGKQQAEQAKREGENARRQAEGISASDRVSKLQDQAKGIGAVDRELKQYHDDIERIRAVNPASALLDPKAIQAGEAAIRKAHQGTVKAASEFGLNARIKELQGQLQQEERGVKATFDQLKADYDLGLLTTREYLDKQYEAKQSALERELVIVRQQEEVARGKKNIAAAEQYKNEEKKILDEIEANFVHHANAVSIESAKAQRAVQAYADSLSSQFNTRQAAIDTDLGGAGLSARERQQQETLNAVRREFDQKAEDLRKQRQRGEANGGISEEVYQAELGTLQDYYQRRLKQEQGYNAKSEQLRGDWTNGAKQAYAEYAESAADAAGQANNLFTDAMQGMEDAIVTFVTTGKLSFKSLVNSILADIARMQAKKFVSSMFGENGSLGGGGGFLGSALTSIFGGGSVNFGQSYGAGSLGTDLSLFYASAKGNVFQTPGLSSFSNRIVNRPTVFAFANGAGLMGEAGPEAVMPLRRGADGRLGVDAGGGRGGAGRQVVIHQHITTTDVASKEDVKSMMRLSERNIVAGISRAQRYRTG